MYFEVKIVKTIDGKNKTELYIVIADAIEEICTKVAKEFEGEEFRITGIVESKYVADYSADTSEIFFKAELIWLTPDDKPIKETYLVEGEHHGLVRDKLIEVLDDTKIENFDKVTSTKILEVIQ